MRSIQKSREPNSLRDLRNTAGAMYSGPQSDWQEALLAEQGHLCAYCMARISMERSQEKGAKPKMEIEHFLPQEDYSDQQLVWSNMLAVCNGSTGSKPHCDKAEGGKNSLGHFIKGKKHGDVTLIRLNPLSTETSEDILIYSLSGEIKSINQTAEVEDDLNLRLNLNDERLVQFRKDRIDLAKKVLETKCPNRRWNQRDFDNEIEIWSTPSEGELKPYYKAIVWFLNWMKQRPRYN